jgi:hypothetical protein
VRIRRADSPFVGRVAPGLCLLLGAAALAAPTALAKGTAVELEIERDNCPVYTNPVLDQSGVVYTVHRGARFALLETQRVPGRPTFFRIRYGSRPEDLGWVGPQCARPAEPHSAAVGSAPPAPLSPGPLHSKLRALIDAYNEEMGELTRAYSLRPFPPLTLAVAAEQASALRASDGRIRLPVASLADDRRLRLPRADKLLFQLLMREAFSASRPPPPGVDIELRFATGPPTLLSCSLADRLRLDRRGVEDFWRVVTGPDKGTLWK